MAGHTCYHCKQWVEEGEAHFTTLADILTLSIMEHLGSKA